MMNTTLEQKANDQAYRSILELNNMKTCACCHQVKPVSEFYLNRGKPRTICKDCFKEKITEQRRDRKKKTSGQEETATTKLPAAGKMPPSSVSKLPAGTHLIQTRPVSSFSTSELIQELKSRGRTVIVDPQPRDALAFLKEQGYRGTLSYVIKKEIDLANFE